MILLAGIVFTIVIWWLVVLVVGGLLGLLARPIVRRLRARWRRRERRAERAAPPGRPRLRALLPDPSSDWWPEFERQFRDHVRAHDRSLRDRPGGDRGR